MVSRVIAVLPRPGSDAHQPHLTTQAHPFFKGIDFANIHLQTPPYVPQLSSPEDTRYFEDDIEDRTLPPPEIAPGIPAPDTTRDLLLRTDQGAALLEVRKGLAFQVGLFSLAKSLNLLTSPYPPGLDLQEATPSSVRSSPWP